MNRWLILSLVLVFALMVLAVLIPHDSRMIDAILHADQFSGPK